MTDSEFRELTLTLVRQIQEVMAVQTQILRRMTDNEAQRQRIHDEFAVEVRRRNDALDKMLDGVCDEHHQDAWWRRGEAPPWQT